LAIQYPGYSLDFDALDAQQSALVSVDLHALDDVNPTCNGIGTQYYIDSDTVAGNINSFCSQDRTGSISESYNNIFIAINFAGTPFILGSDQCSTLFYRILDNCDGNNIDNPYNWKHGGSIKHPAGATLSFIPKGPKP
jgi:hypothetical protein